MAENNVMLESYQQTKYQLGGNGPRNLQVLKRVLEGLDGSLESDMYGKGKVMEDFQNKLAAYLGMESAVFFPSGTMAQQIALRIWCDQKGIRKVAYHPLSHLEIHEEDGMKELHHIEPILLAHKESLIRLEDVVSLNEEIACLLLELPQREIGGQLPSYAELEAISTFCREKGIKLHLDGARLFEILPYYQKSAEEICRLFDSVYVSFYKGIGGIAGAILAGDTEFTEKSKVWKRRHGGDLISLYPYIVSADYYFGQRIGKMEKYYQEAMELATLFNGVERVETKPLVPVSNMFHVHIAGSKVQLEPVFAEVQAKTGIGFSSYLREVSKDAVYFEIGIGDQYERIPKQALQEAFSLFGSRMSDACL